jgi:hypothetical protein
MNGRDWQLIKGDCIEEMAKLESASIDYSCFSPPFPGLYVFSDSPHDLSNNDTYEGFFEHYLFAARQLARIIKPGRLCSVHCMTTPTSKTRDGYIGLKDMAGDIIRAHEAAGMIWHSEVFIWKSPVVQMQRTKALGLLHRQLKKDSAMSRMGLADKVLTFRVPGINVEPIEHTAEDFPVSIWQKIASPCWDDIDQSDVLPCRAASEEDDQKHLCPLQLGVIRRCLTLWSNPGDLVLTPFAGIGSELVVSLQEGRRAIGIELKESYARQAVANLEATERAPRGLFG